MKKLLATTAVALVAFAGAASASDESVLERVLYEIDSNNNISMINGIYANIAETLYEVDIDGSVYIVFTGLDVASMTAIVGEISAIEYLLPTINLGNISTTVLGAVNTGDITLGVNQAVDEAKTTSTNALSSYNTQIGGTVDSGALVLNIASNIGYVDGSINNTMTGVNASVGNAATTVLGAVNTGTIVSGVNGAITGIVGGSHQIGGIAP